MSKKKQQYIRNASSMVLLLSDESHLYSRPAPTNHSTIIPRKVNANLDKSK